MVITPRHLSDDSKEPLKRVLTQTASHHIAEIQLCCHVVEQLQGARRGNTKSLGCTAAKEAFGASGCFPCVQVSQKAFNALLVLPSRSECT